MIDRDEEMILEDGDHFEVRWIRSVSSVLEKFGGKPTPNKKNFVFQKDKDDFVAKLIGDKNVAMVEVGTFITVKG